MLDYEGIPTRKLIESLQERAKELNCLYQIEEILNNKDATLDQVCERIIEAIPPGWQYPDICKAQITLGDKIYASTNFQETEWKQTVSVNVKERDIGSISVYYTREMPHGDYGPFLKEEAKLIRTIADRLGHFIMYYQMRHIFGDLHIAHEKNASQRKVDWEVILNMLRSTDRNLFYDIAYKMFNYLCWSGLPEAEQLRREYGTGRSIKTDDLDSDSNVPHQIKKFTMSTELIDKIFVIASQHIQDKDILTKIQQWIQEDKLNFLVQVMNRNLSLSSVADAVRRYHHINAEGVKLDAYSQRGVQVALIRRLLSNQLQYINIAKEYMDISDFYHLLEKVIFTVDSHGKLGGKSAGMFLASQVIKKSREHIDVFNNIKTPKTWYITSDMILQFMHYNNFAEVLEQKYKEINQIRLEYPHIIHTFKNSHFPQEMVAGLSVALDDFGETPLIVRSSSLLEDGVGMAFSGKYKSLFLANQGTKPERLEALLDAIAEVYASTFSPDPIEYRIERGLIDFDEEMGIMIQEVVGNRVGKYYFPLYAGVAFSNNEFRWSHRINREDGLLRIVPGLGTRAVDRLSDDYPVLIAPGQPNLRVNTSMEDILRYAPRQIDVINLETNCFETRVIEKLLKECGNHISGITKIISIHDQDSIRKPFGMSTDFEKDELVVTFEGLLSDGKFLNQINTMLNLLEEKMGIPVDIEFASDGKDFYLLQCRPQSYSVDTISVPIPRDIPPEDILFTADRFVSNGIVPDITHIVYVDPQKYSEIAEHRDLMRIGKAINKLNKVLPRRKFILMGPGRWGSRGDIKLGVNVTYSDINKTAVLIEIARQKGNYVPDLSFGTHFFQDLVEANIRYLPLYPDDDGIEFNDAFFDKSPNQLAAFLPEYDHLSDTIKVIDVPSCTGGMVLRILLNADIDRAVGMLANPAE